jgi:hypothetical protein
MSEEKAISANQNRSDMTDKAATPPTNPSRRNSALAIGLSAAALAGLIIPTGSLPTGLNESNPSAVTDINTTCCPIHDYIIMTNFEK